ncbi:hypothetical protein F2Y46_18565, partial [Bacteroides caccae]
QLKENEPIFIVNEKKEGASCITTHLHFLLFFFSLCHILCYVILCYRYVNLSETYYEYFVSTIILVTCAL